MRKWFLFKTTLFDSTNWFESKYLSKTFLICHTDLYLFTFSLIIKPIMKELLPLPNLIFYGLHWNSLITHNTLRRLVHCPEAHKDISGELPLALRGVTHIHMILIKRCIRTSIYLNKVIDPSLHNFDLLLFVTCLLAS